MTSERRSYFRIDSEIALSFHSIDNYTLENSSPEEQFPEDQSSLQWLTELRRLDHEASAHLSAISELSRPLADYLHILNKKVDLIAQQSQNSDPSSKSLLPAHVNLSEGGIAFKSRKALYKGSHLALRLRFLNSYSTLLCFASVVRCDSSEADVYKVACRFRKLTGSQRELLAKNIMQAQMAARRRQQSPSS